MAGGAVELIDLNKLYGTMRAVDNISLLIPGGEFFSPAAPVLSARTW